MSAILRALRSPGAMHEVVGVAPSQFPAQEDGKAGEIDTPTDTSFDLPIPDSSQSGYQAKKKPGALDRALDHVVKASGSTPVFIVIQLALLVWAFLGIPFHGSYIWPIIVSDVQAIFSYIFDSFLMRQQLNGYYEGLVVAAELQSRSVGVRRMLLKVHESIKKDGLAPMKVEVQDSEVAQMNMPTEDWFGRFITWLSSVVGHILFVAFYWACILLWLGFGPANAWSNSWQLDINSSTSALMVFIFSFLAILRERHAAYLRTCLDPIYRLDSALEISLRRMTQDEIPNGQVIILPAKVNAVQRAINYYADVVGTLVGIALLIIVIVVWLAIGPALDFDANWWLLIGTYAGLVGMNDGFVLRNVQARLLEHEEPQYAQVATDDLILFHELNIPLPTSELSSELTAKASISYRASERMNKICGHEITVLLGVLLIFGLLIGSSVMRWSETGQLLCNIPPSIIESFFMIILITGHNSADARRRDDLQGIFERRKSLYAFVKAVEVALDGQRVDRTTTDTVKPAAAVEMTSSTNPVEWNPLVIAAAVRVSARQQLRLTGS